MVTSPKSINSLLRYIITSAMVGRRPFYVYLPQTLDGRHLAFCSMKNTLIYLLILPLTIGGLAPAQTPGLDTPTPFAAFSNGVLPQTAPGSSTGWQVVDAFPGLQFNDPISLAPVPGSNDLLVVGKNGQIWRFDNNAAVTQAQVTQVIDLSAKTQTSEDQGFYNLVFHPNFGQAGQVGQNYVYVCYNAIAKDALGVTLVGASENKSYWHVSRFTWNSASGTLDPNSELILINQYDLNLWHNGGAMYFDNQGFLNITCGDGESANWHQKIDGAFYAGIFRIDVDYVPNDPLYIKSHAIRRQPSDALTGRAAAWPASYTQGYGIPFTNPFRDATDPATVTTASVLEEYAVLGLRSPHSAHYDPLTEEIWVGDVGAGAREELDHFKNGDNGQYDYFEGFLAGGETKPSPLIGKDTAPLLDYTHGVGSAIIGGMRYRGALWNGPLGGKVLYGDHTAGKIWAATLNSQGSLDSTELLFEGFLTGYKKGLANFCTDNSGQIFLMQINGGSSSPDKANHYVDANGKIKKLVAQGISTEPPALLSQTGLFSNVANLTPAAGVVPYDVATPLWSDGAHKLRWIALPNNGSHNSAAEDIIFSEEGNWTFPAGTVFIKHFEIGTNQNNPAEVKRLETRLIVCTANGGKYGVTYKWNAAGTDASLLTVGATEDFTIAQTGGGSVTQRWSYPSRAECLQCHNTTAGQALGVRTDALNKSFYYSTTGRTANQLVTFNSLGMFTNTLTVTQLENFIESRAIEDTSAPVEHRVRSYLASNCSHCHQPGSTVPYFDTRLGTPLSQQGIINGTIQGHFELPGGFYIKPGDTTLSAIHVRASNVGNGAAMPPLAKNVVDQSAVNLVTQYINGLNNSQFQTTGSIQARYVRLTANSSINNQVWTTVAEFSILDATGVAIPSGQLSIAAVDSEELTGEGANNGHAIHAIDGNIGTFWHTSWSGAVDPPPPHFITVDLGSLRPVGGYAYTPRNGNGRIKGYQVDYSSDGTTWTAMDSGTWPDDGVVKTYTGLVALRKTRCEIAGPSGTLSGPFDITIAFDKDVTDFTIGDLQVSGGTVTKLRGSGYYYVATISPNGTYVSASVPIDVVNNSLLGNFASNSLSLGADTLGPVPTFTGLPGGSVTGPFNLSIQFNELPVGFSAGSLSAANATLSGLTGSGTTYSVLVSPITQGSFAVTVNPAGISDSLGNSMLSAVTVTLAYNSNILYVEAENGSLTGGMVMVNDASASGSKYIWLPNGSAPANEATPNTTHSASYNFILPRAGNWTLEGLLRSVDSSSNSLWLKVDGGTTYTWDTNTGEIGSGVFTWDALSNASAAYPSVNLIDATTRNGSFELLGAQPGAVSAAKATHWDNDPDGDVTYWNLFPGVTAFNDSGTETNAGLATHGSKVAFLQNGNAAYNMTSYIIQAGDVFTFLWDARSGAAHNVSLVYNNGGILTPLGTPVTSNATGLNKTGTYTVVTGDTCIGKTIGIKLASTGNYPNIDNVRLSVMPSPSPPVDPVVLNLSAGTHTVTVYGREDGTRLDALRFTSDRPLVTLAAPASAMMGSNTAVTVSFSEAVTGLSSGDFSLSGASIASLTGAGANYTLTISPTSTPVTLTLPQNVVVDGSGNGNFDSNIVTIQIQSPNLFDQWATSNGLGAISYSSDADQDGIFALSEFLLNLNPNASGVPIFSPAGSATGLPKVSLVSQRLRIEFPRNAAAVAAGYHYIGQFSSDLQLWDSIETGTIVPMNATWDHMTIEDPLITPAPQTRHARLKLVSP